MYFKDETLLVQLYPIGGNGGVAVLTEGENVSLYGLFTFLSG